MTPGTNLVTGGGGFIGRHLVEQLARRGERVRVLDLAPGDGFPPGVEVVRGSVTDAASVRRALDGVHRVYHLAGNPNLWARDEAEFEVNHRGTRVVLDEAAGRDLERIVFTSTESIFYGKAARGRSELHDESVERSLADMPGAYCRSKLLGERAALEAAGRGQPVVVVNPTLPVGPGDRRLTPPTRMLIGFLNGDFPAYLDCAMNMIDVRDIATGHILAAEKGRIGERYLLGHENLRLRDLLARLGEITGRPMPRLRVPYPVAFATALVSEFVAKRVTGRPPAASLCGVRLSRQMSFDCSKAATELGLAPRPLRDSLADAVAWLVAEGRVRPPAAGGKP